MSVRKWFAAHASPLPRRASARIHFRTTSSLSNPCVRFNISNGSASESRKVLGGAGDTECARQKSSQSLLGRYASPDDCTDGAPVGATRALHPTPTRVSAVASARTDDAFRTLFAPQDLHTAQ